MVASQKLSRGFHRLGLFLAAIPLLWVGLTIMAVGFRAGWASAVDLPSSEVLTTLLVTLGASLALYGVVRAIGWVIGGFTT